MAFDYYELKFAGCVYYFGRTKIGEPNQSDAPATQHEVIVRFDYGSMDVSALCELGEQVERVILAAGVGEYDGDEIAIDGSRGALYMYGPDADALFSAIKTTLAESTSVRNAVATLRYGPADDARQVKVVIEHANLSYVDFPSTAIN